MVVHKPEWKVLLESTVKYTVDPSMHSQFCDLFNQIKSFRQFSVRDSEGKTCAHHLAAAPVASDCITKALTAMFNFDALGKLYQDVQGNGELIIKQYPRLLDSHIFLPRTDKAVVLRSGIIQATGCNRTMTIITGRNDMIDSAMQAFNVDVNNGNVQKANDYTSINVLFEDETGAGDGVLREWFDELVTKIIDPKFGLFLHKDHGRLIMFNPHRTWQLAATTWGTLGCSAMSAHCLCCTGFRCLSLNH